MCPMHPLLKPQIKRKTSRVTEDGLEWLSLAGRKVSGQTPYVANEKAMCSRLTRYLKEISGTSKDVHLSTVTK